LPHKNSKLSEDSKLRGFVLFKFLRGLSTDGDLEFCIYDHSENGVTFEITNVVFHYLWQRLQLTTGNHTAQQALARGPLFYGAR